ncbi:MAG: hypothetical protein R3C32_08410 [Chloroflexota bacterium]
MACGDGATGSSWSTRGARAGGPGCGITLRVDVALDGRPASLLAERATPTWSDLRAIDEGLTIEVAKRGPRDAIVRVALAAPVDRATTAEVLVTLAVRPSGPDDAAPCPRVAWEATGASPGATVLRVDLPDRPPWWLVDARDARVEPSAAEGGLDGTGALALRHQVELAPGQTSDVRLRLSESDEPRTAIGPDADATLAVRARESEAWLADGFALGQPDDVVARRLVAELLARPPSSRLAAALDAVAVATIDPSRARAQLLDSLAAWAHDAEGPTEGPGTPPLEAWAALRVHDLLLARTGREDPRFLEEACSRLLTATSWWVDRLDPDGRGALQGGLPPIDGPRVLPRGVVDGAPDVAHADGTAWLAVHTVAMLRLASAVAHLDRTYADMAVTFLDSAVTMIDALDAVGGGLGMWDQAQGAHLDVARAADGTYRRIPIRSLVSLVPLLAVTVIPAGTLERLPALAARVDGVLAERPELSGSIIRGPSGRRDRGDVLVSVVSRSRLGWALEHVLDPEGHLSPYGIRTLSRAHRVPVRVDVGAGAADVRYRPAGARDADGVTLWQGQVSVTLTLLLADALRAHGAMGGSPLLIEHPTGSGRIVVADEVADDRVSRVLHALRRLAADGRSPVGVEAIDAESGGAARPRGAEGRSSLPLVALWRPAR